MLFFPALSRHHAVLRVRYEPMPAQVLGQGIHAGPATHEFRVASQWTVRSKP